MTSLIFKRSLWTVATGSAKALVLAQGTQGLVFKHRSIQIILQKYGIDNDSIIVGSLEKLKHTPNMASLVGKIITYTYDIDVFGLPTKGDIIGAYYITSIKEDPVPNSSWISIENEFHKG